MTRLFSLLALALVIASPAAADFSPIRDRGVFLSTVEGRTLAIPLFGISLAVGADGSIGGTAQGEQVTGSWSWQDGYFCRTLSWGSRSWPQNCQLVEVDGSRLRFTADQGQGDTARFTIR
ncbi:dihydrodipicolinate reductase [Histidinibacterium lentulum]|uniref:Dihydrodipicolinate reductase n=1 Tax=Histidinibacterium lentulum TaxID=2480588 RepID=A0A3N2R5T5_9RHOB|nr:dihydrodipicolinate reductase [Histidinibacterium lentulum]ROU02850.1 dihydrodipicolinate reductase [Histidinibacterium lentulum]